MGYGSVRGHCRVERLVREDSVARPPRGRRVIGSGSSSVRAVVYYLAPGPALRDGSFIVCFSHSLC